MTPRRILKEARQKGLQIIAISDHNTAENVPAVVALSSDVVVIPSLEVTTSEEAHILALMPDLASALRLQEMIYRDLPVIGKESRLYTDQVVVDKDDYVVRFCDRLLINAVKMSAKEVVEEIHELGGLAIACHIDREVFSLLTQLGFIPEDIELDGIEISFRTSLEEAKKQYYRYLNYPWLRNSDAHSPEEIGRVTTELYLEEPTLEEIKLALRGEGQRRVVI